MFASDEKTAKKSFKAAPKILSWPKEHTKVLHTLCNDVWARKSTETGMN